jgi:type IX secretion system PorP/SprF family membrane protein
MILHPSLSYWGIPFSFQRRQGGVLFKKTTKKHNMLHIFKHQKRFCTALALALMLASANLSAQQDPMYSQYHFNGLVINPAYAGTHDVLSATLLYRNQWVGLPGAPKTFTFSADAPFRKNKVGLGLSVISDKIGVSSKTGIFGVYAYKIPLARNTLSLGLQFGFNFFSSNYAGVEFTNQSNKTDNAFSANFSDGYPNFGLGAYYYNEKFYVGASLPQFVNQTFLNKFFNKPEVYRYDQANHFFVTSGYVFRLSNDLSINPSVLMKYVNGAPIEMDLNATTWFYELLGVGMSYRSLDAINVFSEVKVTPQLFLGYAFEYSLTGIRSYNSGTHEIMLRYDFDFASPRVITPRYF